LTMSRKHQQPSASGHREREKNSLHPESTVFIFIHIF
jgi:hypothetical protein